MSDKITLTADEILVGGRQLTVMAVSAATGKHVQQLKEALLDGMVEDFNLAEFLYGAFGPELSRLALARAVNNLAGAINAAVALATKEMQS